MLKDQKKHRLPKSVRIILKTISVLLLVFFVAIAIALNFVFTPEKITPKILAAVNSQTKATVKCEAIDPTFFSTFPYFSIQLKQGEVVYDKVLDSNAVALWPNDTLISFEKCQVNINLMKLLVKKQIDVRNIIFDSPRIFAYVNQEGNANWDIFKVKDSTESKEADTTSTNYKAYLKEYNISKMRIVNAQLKYHDSLTNAHVSIDRYNLNLSISKEEELFDFEIGMTGEDINFSKDNQSFVKHLNLEVKTGLQYEKPLKKLSFKESKIRANGVDFIGEGQLVYLKLEKQLKTNLNFELDVPSLKTVVDLIPESILQYKNEMHTDGTVLLNAQVTGVYGKNIFPEIDAQLTIDNGKFSFESFPGKIDMIHTTTKAHINFNDKEKSQLTVEQLDIKGTGIDLSAYAEVDNIIENAQVDAKVEGELDFTTLKETFPLNDSLVARGVAQIDLEAQFSKNQIVNQQYKNINAHGNVHLKDIFIKHLTEQLTFESEKADAVFGRAFADENHQELQGEITAKDLKFEYKNLHKGTLKALSVGLETGKKKENKGYLTAKVAVDNLKYSFKDSVNGLIKNSNAAITFKETAFKKRPLTITNFNIDSAAVWTKTSFVGVTKGIYQLTFENDAKKIWMPKGFIESNALYAYTPSFPMVIQMQHSKLSVGDGNLYLNEAKFKFGNSDATLTGVIPHLVKSIKEKKNFKATLDLKANYIDGNQIMATLNKADAIDTVKVVQTVYTENKKAFKVPKEIDFKFETNIKTVKWGDIDISDINGLITAKNGSLKLENLDLITLESKLNAYIDYQANSNTDAEVSFDFKLNDVKMSNLVRIVPALDSLFPMAKAFEGEVDFRMKGETHLNENMDVKVSSVKSIAALRAQDLMVFDGPTFTALAKKLKFKNREKNPIDSLEVEMKIENGAMLIYPAKLVIDRYKLAAGGIQKLDQSYTYHLSILKSPIPFKTGIDVTGDFSDFDIKITKAKYKNYFDSKRKLTKKADKQMLKEKEAIKKALDF